MRSVIPASLLFACAKSSSDDSGLDANSDGANAVDDAHTQDASSGEDVSTDSGATDSGAPDADACTQDINAVIGTNHPDIPHKLVVPLAIVRGGNPAALNLSAGPGGHQHSVEVPAGHFAALLRGESVDVVSGSTFGHSHSVTFKCSA